MEINQQHQKKMATSHMKYLTDPQYRQSILNKAKLRYQSKKYDNTDKKAIRKELANLELELSNLKKERIFNMEKAIKNAMELVETEFRTRTVDLINRINDLKENIKKVDIANKEESKI